MPAIYIRQRVVNALGIFQANSPGLGSQGRRLRPDIMRQGGGLSPARYITPDLPSVSTGRHSGVVEGCVVTASSPASMSVTVTAGHIIYLDVAAQVQQTTVTLAAADATNDRIDAIASTPGGTVVVLQGAYADGLNVKPPILDGYVLLAYITVFSQASSSYTGTITQAVIDGLLAGRDVTDVRPFQDLPAPSNTLAYTFVGRATADADPGPYNLACNGSTLGTVTQFYVNFTSFTAPENERYFTRTPPYYLRFWSRKFPGSWVTYFVSSVTSHSTYDTLTVALADAGGPRGTGGATGGWSVGVIFSTDAADTIAQRDSSPLPGLTRDLVFNAGDVTMTNANQFYDGATLGSSIGGDNGVYWIYGQITVVAGGVANVTARIWDGSTTIVESQQIGGTANPVTLPLQIVVTPSASTTYKISAASTSPGGTIKRDPTSNSSGLHLATNLGYFRIA